MKEDNKELKQSIADMLEEESREEQREREEKHAALMEKLGIDDSDISLESFDDEATKQEILKIMDGSNKLIFDQEVQIQALQHDVQMFEEERDEYKDKYLRALADLENRKKQFTKDVANSRDTATMNTLRAILPVVDDFERAIESNKENWDGHGTGVKMMKDGFELIYNKLISTLEHLGCKNMDCLFDDFDTDYHEAVALVDVESEAEKGKVVEVTQTGWMYKDSVLRYAKVVVGK